MLNLLHCVRHGHEIVALANLCPPTHQDELDSYMYQTVGHDVIPLYAEAMGLPLFRRTISGSSVAMELEYEQTEQDEVEDLFVLLKQIKYEIPELQGVSVGAILSNYQRIRVEHV
jgi:diphthine-ammonia ligase